jgi:hypothetical protein
VTPRAHFALLEAQLAARKRKHPWGANVLPLGSSMHARRHDGYWEIGYFTNRKTYERDPVTNKYELKIHPREDWKFKPLAWCLSDAVVIPNPWSITYFGVYTQHRKTGIDGAKSPKHKWYGHVVQGEGALRLEHHPDGTVHTMRTEHPALLKTWDKAKYAAQKQVRVKAERVLRAILRMGGLATEKEQLEIRPDADTITPEEYTTLLTQVAEADGEPTPEAMERLAAAIKRYTYAWWGNRDNPEKTFNWLRDQWRTASYEPLGIVTWEPTDDDRHIKRLP